MREPGTLDANIVGRVDVDALREEVRKKYREVADQPQADFHFHTGRAHAQRMGYPMSPLDRLPDEATEAFAGVANPFYWGLPEPGERVVDLGSGAGMDSLIAAMSVGPTARVVGIDMTEEMIEKAAGLARDLGLDNVEFRHGLIEDLPLESEWADLVISNGVINLCPDKAGVYKEINRVLKPAGRMTIADICVEKPVPEAALEDIDLWTGWIAGALPCAGWGTVIEAAGLVDIEFAGQVDTFEGAGGEYKARQFGTTGYSIRARKPVAQTR